MKYQDIVYIAELGLNGDKRKLLDVLKKCAAEASNNKQYSLYQGLKNVVSSYPKKSNSEISSSIISGEEYNPVTNFESMPENVWLPKRLAYRIDHLLRLYQYYSKSKSLHRKLNKILLYGPPGTGKTTLGFYIANKLRQPIHYIKVSDVISSKFGETMRNIANIFHSTNNGIIFIDEFDAFAKNRTDSNDVGELKRIVNSLIQTLDFYNSSGIVIVATNLIESLDPAILRRFPYQILVDKLDKEEQAEFLKFILKTTKNISVDLSTEDLRFIESLIFGLDLSTVDQIQQLVDKSILLTMMRKNNKLQLSNFVESVLSSDYINQNTVKEIHKQFPQIIKKIGIIMEKEGYSMSHISELLGIHRNSYGTYAQKI